MFLPQAIDVLGHVYTVRERDDDEFQETYHGRCDLNRQIIDIAIDRGLDMQRETLLHEVLHAIADGLAIGIDESQVQRLGRGIYNVLKANPDLVAYLAPDA